MSWSRKLTLDSKGTPRKLVVKKLNSIKGLRTKLEKGLARPDQRAYALDVIAALKDDYFLTILEKDVLSDPDGYSVLTLNTLLDGTTYKNVGQTYKAALVSDENQISAGATVAMVDSLARWGVLLDLKTVRRLLSHPFPEVAIATVAYMEVLGSQFRKTQFMKLNEDLLALKPYQVRLRALYYFDLLGLRRIERSTLKKCLSDSHPIVKRKCHKFYKKWEEASL